MFIRDSKRSSLLVGFLNGVEQEGICTEKPGVQSMDSDWRAGGTITEGVRGQHLHG